MDIKQIIESIANKYNEKVRLVEELFKVSFSSNYNLEDSKTMICSYLENGTLGGASNV